MADEDLKPVEVTIPDDAEPVAPPEKPAEAKVEAKQPEPGLEELRREVEELRRRNEEAERRNQEIDRVAREQAQEALRLRQQADQHSAEITDSRYQNVLSTIDAFRRDTEIAKRDQAAALAAGNFEGFSEAQQRISRAEAQIVQLEAGKYALEQQAQQAKQQQEYQQQQPQQRVQTPQERFEEYLSQFSMRSQNYLRAHPEYATEEKLNRRLMRAHGEAVDDEGIIPDTDAYFEYLDSRMAPAQQRQAPQRQAAAGRSYAAPVSRQPVGGSRGGGSITLSPAERDAARISGVSDVEYAKQLIALEAAGEIVRH